MDEERQSEELKKLKLEVIKLDKEIKALQRPPLLHPSAYIPLVVAIIGFIGAGVKLQTTTVERNEARVQTNEARVQTNEAKLDARSAESYSAGLASAVESHPTKLNVVTIKFRGSLTREQITGLQQQFNASGIVAPRPTRTEDIGESGITYYHAEDKTLADSVATHVSAYFVQLGCPLNIQPVGKTVPPSSVNLGTIELAVYHSCN